MTCFDLSYGCLAEGCVSYDIDNGERIDRGTYAGAPCRPMFCTGLLAGAVSVESPDEGVVYSTGMRGIVRLAKEMHLLEEGGGVVYVALLPERSVLVNLKTRKHLRP